MSRGKDCLMASCSFAKPVPKEPNQTQGLSTFAAKPGMSRDDDILVVRWLSQPPERGAQPGAAAVHKARAWCEAGGASTPLRAKAARKWDPGLCGSQSHNRPGDPIISRRELTC